MSAEPKTSSPSAPCGRAEGLGASQDEAASQAPTFLRSAARRLGPRAAQSLHASCVVIGESGILIRGVSGSGKSSLALALLSRARRDGDFAAWVADDRVLITALGRRLVASPHPVVAGSFEARGLGILEEPHEPRTVLRLFVDLEEDVARLPARGELTARVAGVALRRLPLVARRAGLYETSLVLRLARMPLEKDGRQTLTCRVGGVAI